MSNQQRTEREPVHPRTAGQPRDAGPQRSAAADRSEDHLIRGYN
jgi:hypothetical protein